MDEKKVRVTVYMTPDEKKQLRLLAVQTGQTATEIAAQAIRTAISSAR